ncbi:hypothetical protein SAMN05660657_05277 [Geodermatophilus amargosae]|uniref:Uncharacterized protein n=1 Tax=Geodermatophilus amargosae TaxID=1296565 RepID=A0A1I7D484_9ACTN|nr:hypothetical protein [Geodermatophilus amargosae]SFU06426.1 hypothetical protein SAMN05660657_05277 [Geodermatophilus amargosae]
MTATGSAPDRGALSGPASGVLFLAGVAGALVTADVPYPRPGSDAATIRRFFHGNRGPARVSATGQLLSAAALARFTASVVRLSAPAGRDVRTAAAVGGAVAVASLTASSVVTTALTTDRAADDDRAVTLHRRAFLAGGVVHGAGFGLLVAALGVAGRRTGLLPVALSRAALGSAAAGLLAPLHLVAEPAAWVIPAGRFSGLLVTGISGVRMARGGLPSVRR